MAAKYPFNSEDARHSKRKSVVPIRELEERTGLAMEDLKKLLSISPSDICDDHDTLKDLATTLKSQRDIFHKLSRELTSRLSNSIGSVHESHSHRQVRSEILSDVSEQLKDIRNILNEQHNDEITADDSVSIVSDFSYQDYIKRSNYKNIVNPTLTNRSKLQSFVTSNDNPNPSEPYDYEKYSRFPNSLISPCNDSQVQFNLAEDRNRKLEFESMNIRKHEFENQFESLNIQKHENLVDEQYRHSNLLRDLHRPASSFVTSESGTSSNARENDFNISNPFYPQSKCFENYKIPTFTVGSSSNPFQTNPLNSNNNVPLNNNSHHYPPFNNNFSANNQHSSQGIKAPLLDPLSQYLMKQDLIKNTIEPFDGTAYKFQSWLTQIEARTKNLPLAPLEYLHILLSNSSGEPKKYIQDTLAMNVITDTDTVKDVMSTLQERYGSSLRASEQLRSKLFNFPMIKGNRSTIATGLQKFYDLCKVILSYQRSCPHLNDLDYPAGQSEIRNKLPDCVLERWQTFGHSFQDSNKIYPPLCVIVNFLKDVSREFSNSDFGRSQNTNYYFKRETKTFYTQGIDNPESQPQTTDVKESNVLCSFHPLGTHNLVDCRVFFKLPFAEKINIARKEGRCFACLGKHLQVDCKADLSCEICNNDHCTAMHKRSEKRRELLESPENPNTSDKFNENIQSLCTNESQNKYKSCSKTMQVSLTMKGIPNKSLSCFLIIDEQSNSSFVDPKIVSFFGRNFPMVDYSLTTLNGSKTMLKGMRVHGLEVKGKNQKEVIHLPELLTSSFIPNSKEEIASPELVRRHAHIAKYADKFVEPDNELDVLLLVGRDCGRLMATKCFGDKAPYVHKTPLGWAMVGETCVPTTRAEYRTLKSCTIEHFSAKNSFSTKENYCELDFPTFHCRPDDDEEGLSQEDRKFLHKMKDCVNITVDGKMEFPLPFKDCDLFPNNKLAVFNRTKNTLNNMKRFPDKLHNCVEIMENNLKLGHLEEVPNHETKPCDGNAWWLPIFAVQHKQKKKYRLVFDGSAMYDNVSLNNKLMSGPDLNNQLRSVLLRFREDNIGFIADVEGMFNAFRVPSHHTNYLRFFWFSRNNPNNPLVEFRALYHIFGARSSPAVANFAMKYTTSNPVAAKYPNCIDFIRKSFYVDDGISCAHSEDAAIKILTESRSLLGNFGINLHKIASNSKKVLAAFPSNARATEFLSLDFENLPSTRTLGLTWNAMNDEFEIEVNIPDRAFTKRGILSTINSLYDPLGVVSPVSLSGRLIQRKLISSQSSDQKLHNLKWDDPLPLEYEEEWIQWKQTLSSLKHVHLPRSFRHLSIDVIKQELHVYCDASDVAIGYVAYMKTFDSSGNTNVSFVLGNSKLTPKAATTIPRLELCSALEAARAAKWITSELKYNVERVYFYSDSNVTLGYIRNATRRFSKYVSRRINAICTLSSPSQWKYIQSKSNPADIASRPQRPHDLINTIWFSGPCELTSEINFIETEDLDTFTGVLPEQQQEEEDRSSLKTCKVISIGDDKTESSIDFIISRAKTFRSLIKTVVVVYKMFFILDGIRQKFGCSLAPRNPTLSDEDAIIACVNAVQCQSFSLEKKLLSKFAEVPDSNIISDLSPFVDSSDTIRVGGRITKARLPFSAKHPILLPMEHQFTRLVVEHYHESVGHQGRYLTHGSVRSAGFHILNGRKLIRLFLKSCVLCQKLRGPRMMQRMADLPRDRIEQVPPFSHIGLDVFGPFYVHEGKSTRQGSSQKKIWIVIFCCLVSRAVHCEAISSMDTTAFVNALRRFIAVRGTCTIIRSDCGTNFTCAKSQFDQLDLENVQKNTRTLNCSWIFNPPGASHFGGCYERKIGSIRRVLDKSLLQASPRGLSRDEMITLVQEACSIVNQTPLYETSDHPDDPTPITPFMLLTLREFRYPENLNNFSPQDLLAYGKTRWRRVQYLVQEFWRHWRENYLLTLNKRHKWTKLKPCATEGDIVLVSEKNAPRNQWITGKIVSVNTSNDGLIRSAQIKLPSHHGNDKNITRAIHDLVLLMPSKNHKC